MPVQRKPCKVLLVRPKAANMLGYLNVVDVEPLELEYLYTVLREDGFEAVIYDALLDRATLSDVLRKERPDVVCITGYITQSDLMRKYASTARRLLPRVRVILGGVHVEVNHRDFFGDSDVDYLVHTSAPAPFVELVRCIADGREADVASIDGLCLRDADGVWRTTPPVTADINDLPIPDRTYFHAHIDRFKYLHFKPCATLKTAYGCPNRCHFCFCRKLNQSRYSARDMTRVMDEIETIRCPNIYIVDDDFLVDKARLEQFVELIRERGIERRFLVYGRADFVAANPDWMRRLRQAGVRLVMVGLESFLDDRLDAYGKRSSRAINERCIEVLRECDILCMGFLMVDPGTTREDFKALGDWIEAVGLTYVSVAIFTPIPGTDSFEEYRNRLIDTDPRHFDLLHCMVQPERMSLREYYRECHKLYLRIFRIARRRHAYDFLDLTYYRQVFDRYFRTLIKE